MARKEISQNVRRAAQRRAIAGESYRAIGKDLGIDHKSVARLHEQAKKRPPPPAGAPKGTAKRKAARPDVADEDLDPDKLREVDLLRRVQVRNGLLTTFDDTDDPKARALVAIAFEKLSDSILKRIGPAIDADDGDDEGADSALEARFSALLEKGGELIHGPAQSPVPAGPDVYLEPVADGATGPGLRSTGTD